MLCALRHAFAGILIFVGVSIDVQAAEQSSTVKADTKVEGKGTIYVPDIPPPNSSSPQRPPDPRCWQLTSEQQRNTPGC
jgi:hypothetical protein